MKTPRRFKSRFRTGALLFGTAVTLVAPTVGRAVDLDQRVAFDIAPQNLVSALIDFSRQADLQVMSAGSDLKDRWAPGVHGRYAIGQALDLLLAGSGLSYKAAGRSTVAVVSAAPSTAPVDPPAEAPPQTQTAQAQTAQAAPLEKVEVTGSHIKRSEAETVENVQIISSQQIQQSGQETVADFLRTISATFGNNSNESFANSFAPGAAMIGLRGLSQKDTLVLLNGRRITNYGLFLNLSDSFVDLNVIPVTAIDRVEVLKSGGSAIYGSDAIAGVVNIILRQNTTEKTVEAGGRVTTEGGAASYEASALLGFGDFQADHYNVVLGVGGFKRNQLLFSQRSYTKSLDFRNQPDGILGYRPSNQYSGVPEAFPTCGKNGLPGQVINSGGSIGPGCYYNQANELPLLPATDRGNLIVTGNLRLSSDWTAFGDVFFSTIKTTSSFTPRNFGPGAWVFNPATGGVTSIPNNLLATDPSALGKAVTPIFYDFQTVGPRDEDTISNTYRVTAGVKGNWLSWDWEGAYGHSENNVRSEQVNGINATVLMSDLAAGMNDPYNFLNPLSTPAATNALRVGYGYTGIAKLDTFGLKGTGGIFDLPGGPANAAAGVELRHETAHEEPSASLSEGLVLNTGVTKADASRTVTAAYLEFDLPIIRTLEADLAAREEHYTMVGSNFSPQATLRWQPVREFTFRGVGSKGFRAPSLAEGSNSTSLANQTASDPLDPAHRKTEAVGFITGGNPNLQPETSKNLDLGFIVSPFDNVNFSVDYYSIWLYSVIASNGSAQSIISNPSAYPPGSLVRAPGVGGAPGAVIYAKGLYTNLYEIRTDGVDFAADITFTLPDSSKLKFALDATYVPTFLVFCGSACAGPPVPWQNYAGSNGWDYASPISGGNAIPRWKGLISAAWHNSQWSGEVVGHFIDRYTNIFSQPVFGNFLTQQSVSPYASVDLDGQYRWRNWKATLSIINVSDNKPPYDSSALLFGTFVPPVAQPFDIGLYDPLGRMIDLHLSYTF